MALSPKEMDAAVRRNLKSKTGHDLTAWIALLKAERLATDRERVAWLERAHHLGHVTAQVIVRHAKGVTYGDDQALIDALYQGAAEPLRALHQALAATIRSIADEVEEVPCKTYVGFRVKRQFAVLKPADHAVLLGLALGTSPARGRLQPARRLASSRITHAIRVSSLADIDAPLRAWVTQAFGRSG